MLHAGNAIDATLGVTFGLSTLAAAACGQHLGSTRMVSSSGLVVKVRFGQQNNGREHLKKWCFNVGISQRCVFFSLGG